MHGYSSSEESDDPLRPHPVPASANAMNKTKTKKKKTPPQPSINHIWKKFHNKKFNKALAVLPFDPVLPPASSDKPNELLSAGYERAVEECRRKVLKIIQECRRVNMRYRDPGWDLDWDLKWRKGHCLNTLGHTKWELSKITLLNPDAFVPKAVKRVHEIFEKPTFLENVNGGDVKQGSLGDCWLMAALTALANTEGGIQRICVEYDTRVGVYGFVFYRDGEWVYSIIDDKLYLKSPCWDLLSMQRCLLEQIDREDVERVYRKTYQTGSKALFFAQCKDQNETWVPLIEKAYAKAHGDFGSLAGGWIGEGLEDLSGGVTTELLTSDILDLEGFWENGLAKVNEEFLFGCSTGLLDRGYGERNGISEGHAYVINYDDFLRKFQHIDRTRLFHDPAWRCAQRWIGVEVPWKSQFNEKFQIKLSKDGPLVLVLTQLDTRYFKGLQGQYSFRIHFRIHERDRPGAEDYIVRSHGNYLMDRSVSIELPDMPAGEYSIFMSVTGERDTNISSVEDVVKRECKKRVENAKLAQIGAAYDLAHSKGTAHLQEVARLRKIKEQQKASESRQKERRKLWERRHTNREVTKQQTKKNNEKRDRKLAKKTEAAKAKADLEAAQKAAADANKAEEAKPLEEKPKDQAVQTEVAKEESKDVAAGGSKSDGTNESKEESKEGSKEGSKEESKDEVKEDVADEKPVDKTAPEPPAQKSYDSDGDSSDSPIEDWEELFSEDDMVRKPRLTPAGPPKRRDERYESEEEGLPDPWNAICIVGVRVYSMDENVEVRVYMEGGELLEDGMGKKGEADIDNAQVNASGEREELKPDSPEAAKPDVDSSMIEEREEAAEEPKSDEEEKNEDSKSERSDKNSVDSTDYDKLHFGTSTPDVAAASEATPIKSHKELC
ncbi:calpain family cysteine protease [Colletotrichum abscissum]|uniref:Calpain family cysteine protease n=1 Tax=Colletotrichum abscissum TaxID=1671311 RepID=A0A9Q0AY52_9PEZI|nr:calpain family cysteine protease [Colletotrichum abscissum]